MVPADLSPAQFFETYLPAEWTRARTGAAPPSDASIEVVLDGDGGGTWTLALAGGALAVTAAPATTTPALRVHMTTADFRAVLQGEAGAPDLFPKDVDLPSLIARIPPHGASPLGPLVGAVEISITGFHGRTWKVALATNGATTTGATVSVDADTIIALRDGKLDPMGAFFGGKIVLGGDFTSLLQAGMSFMKSRGAPN